MSRRLSFTWLAMVTAVASCNSTERPDVSSRAAALTDDALVGEWLLAESDGQSIADTSGGGNDGMLGSTPYEDEYDPSWTWEGPALVFEGPRYARVPNAPRLEPANQVTVEAWVRGGVQNPSSYLVAKGGQNCDYASYALRTGSGGLDFYVFDGSAVHASPEAAATIWDTSWHHVAGTYDGAQVRLFVDGAEVGTGTPAAGGSIGYGLSPSNDLYLGTYGGTCDLPFNGGLRGVRVYNRALNAAEVAERFQASPPIFPRPHCTGAECVDPDPAPPPAGTQSFTIPVQTFRTNLHNLLVGSELHVSSLQEAPPSAGLDYFHCEYAPATDAERAACTAKCQTLESPELQRCLKGCSGLQVCHRTCGTTTTMAGYFSPGLNLKGLTMAPCTDASETCPACIVGSPDAGMAVQAFPVDIPPFWVLDLAPWKCFVTAIDWDMGNVLVDTGNGVELNFVGDSRIPTVNCHGGYDFDVTNTKIHVVLAPYVDSPNNTINAAVFAEVFADVAVSGRWDPVASNIAHDHLVPAATGAVNKVLDAKATKDKTLRTLLGEAVSKMIMTEVNKLEPGYKLLSVRFSPAGVTVDYTPTCHPSCPAHSCGGNGCGGTCNGCTSGETCQGGTCVCTPHCDGKSCGDDGCGGSCGTCASSQQCNAEGQCVCAPHCDGKTCGDDGCGGSCGPCNQYPNSSCQSGQCVCTPQTSCVGRCGHYADGCGGTTICPPCTCTPSCKNKKCGASDGCGGECPGSCTKAGQHCTNDGDGYFCTF